MKVKKGYPLLGQSSPTASTHLQSTAVCPAVNKIKFFGPKRAWTAVLSMHLFWIVDNYPARFSVIVGAGCDGL